jgi:hypothetical protein
MNTHLSKIRPTEWMLLATFATYLVVGRAWAKSDVDVNSSRVSSFLLVLAGICLLVIILGCWVIARRKCWFSIPLFLIAGLAQLYIVLFHDIGNETGKTNRGNDYNYYLLFIGCLALFMFELRIRSRIHSAQKLPN